MNSQWTIGIDNGLTGGICLLSPKSEIVGLTTFVIVKHDKKNEISPIYLHDYLNVMLPFCTDGVSIFIEKPVGAKSANAMRSMAASFATIHAVCSLLQYKDSRITKIERVKAKDWQKLMLEKGVDTKKAAVKKAKQLWPEEEFLATSRSKVPHLGLVDAALIAECGRRYGTDL